MGYNRQLKLCAAELKSNNCALLENKGIQLWLHMAETSMVVLDIF